MKGNDSGEWVEYKCEKTEIKVFREWFLGGYK